MLKISNFLTKDEQKVLYFLLIFGFLGLVLQMTNLVASEQKTDYEKLEKVAAEKVEIIYDIRTATIKELENLPGVGPSRAEEIINFRDEEGFAKSSDLMKVKGIGPRTYERIKKKIVIFGEKKSYSSQKSVSQKININTANIDELSTLKGIGPSKAKKIIEFRTRNGNFGSIEQLAEVKGIGPKTVEKNRERISIKDE